MNDHAYKGSAPVRTEDKVELLSLGEVYDTAIVHTVMATQFMCTTKENTLFFFYSDKGDTWRIAE